MAKKRFRITREEVEVYRGKYVSCPACETLGIMVDVDELLIGLRDKLGEEAVRAFDRLMAGEITKDELMETLKRIASAKGVSDEEIERIIESASVGVGRPERRD